MARDGFMIVSSVKIYPQPRVRTNIHPQAANHGGVQA